MFGISLAELILVVIVALVFIKPQDLPEIAHFLGRMVCRVKILIKDVKEYFNISGKEFGLDELKYELNRGIAEEKAKLDDGLVIIVDTEGKEHKIPKNNLPKNVDEEEIKILNKQNQAS